MISKQIPKFAAPWCLSLEKSAGVIATRMHEGERQFLLMRYPHGHWEFPRGHMEEGETEVDTARRETEEETGISDFLIIEGFRETFSFWYKARGGELRKRKMSGDCMYIHKKVIFYLAEMNVTHVTLSHEHRDFAWLSYKDARRRLTYDNGRHVLKQAHDHYEDDDI